MLRRLMPWPQVLRRLHAAAHPHALPRRLLPYQALVKALHEAASATKAAAAAADAVAAAAAHPRGDPLAFFELAAGVIPILYLAIAYQSSAWEPRTPAPGLEGRLARSAFHAAQLAVAACAVGEAVALNALVDSPTLAARRAVASAVVIAGGVLVSRPLMLLGVQVDLRKRSTEPYAGWATGFAIYLAGALGILAIWL